MKTNILFFIISLSVLRMRNVLYKFVEKIITHVLCSITIFFGNRAIYEIMWKQKIAEPDRPQMTIWDMRIACWITKAANTHSE